MRVDFWFSPSPSIYLLSSYIPITFQCSAFFKGPYSSQCNEAQHSDLPFMGAKRKDIREKCLVLILALNSLYLNNRFHLLLLYCLNNILSKKKNNKAFESFRYSLSLFLMFLKTRQMCVDFWFCSSSSINLLSLDIRVVCLKQFCFEFYLLSS